MGRVIKAGRVLLALAACLLTAPAWGQAYPNKPLKMILPFPAGGPTDIVARAMGQGLAEALGHNVVIDNRPGGGGLIGATLAAKAPGDGYTLLLGGITTFGVAPSVHKNLAFDPVKDFLPVTMATRQPILLMMHPSLPVKSVREFIALAKARPGEINYASSGPGGSGHMAGELFRLVTGVNLVHIPYKGAPPALNELIAGQVQVMFGTILASAPHIRSGRVRAIAITGPQRSTALPEVMTFSEAGLPTYDASSWNGVLVPAGTPRAVVDRLNAEIVRILKSPNVLERLAQDGALPAPTTPEEFAAFMKAEIAKWAKVVQAANIRID
ncbi:MAG: tripartite tricarboxylate transporter substrate binding protein [Proteobacteria bacterium]|nr:tripartite tricarboxylate transporter substrate binding protein [Pseudomonadota bacterium]